jgi:ABC-type glycerol-3-phosphate transport system substrate-binding protein
MRRMRAGVLVVVFVLVSAAVAAACGGDDDGAASASASGSAVAPEALRATAAEVENGLNTIKTTATGIAAAVEADPDAAERFSETIEPAWEKIEGTIKANDSDAYISFEDTFAVLGNAIDEGDAAEAESAAETINTTADAYLERYAE